MAQSPPETILTTSWESPSNLAIVKYWGKREVQIPENASVSFTLSRAVTTTSVGITPHTGGGFKFCLGGREQPSFEPKIKSFLDLALPLLPHLHNFFLTIESRNSFPHSSGIASSASSMSALALCLVDLEGQLSGTATIDLPLASSLARLGSGSAARSVYGGWNLWGRMEEFPESSDNYAVPVPITPAPVFHDLHDDILIISSQSKRVSSSEGHRLMHHHPYRAGRLQQARKHALALMDYLEAGDVDAFIELAETEALSLHALMMSGTPGYTLLQPNTLEAINRVKTFRKESGLPLGFSLDAGPNLHLLYPDEQATPIKRWISEALLPLCEDQKIIEDQVGPGPARKTNKPNI